jgi:3-oxoacyl-[acyl-carrier protein] reductase
MSMALASRFAGRKAVVTGGAAGIGRALAARLAAEGAAVFLWELDETALAASAAEVGAKGTCAVDVADASAVAAAMAQSDAATSGLDSLVCSAGIIGPSTTLRDYPIEAWQRVIDINLNGLFNCNRAAVSAMQQGGYGRIVNVAFIAGNEGNPNASAYSASYLPAPFTTQGARYSDPGP